VLGAGSTTGGGRLPAAGGSKAGHRAPPGSKPVLGVGRTTGGGTLLALAAGRWVVGFAGTAEAVLGAGKRHGAGSVTGAGISAVSTASERVYMCCAAGSAAASRSPLLPTRDGVIGR